MKFILSLFLISFTFVASAESNDVLESKTSVTVEHVFPGPGKKKARHGKRMNKKRKRKCTKAARRNFAG